MKEAEDANSLQNQNLEKGITTICLHRDIHCDSKGCRFIPPSSCSARCMEGNIFLLDSNSSPLYRLCSVENFISEEQSEN